MMNLNVILKGLIAVENMVNIQECHRYTATSAAYNRSAVSNLWSHLYVRALHRGGGGGGGGSSSVRQPQLCTPPGVIGP